MVSESRDVFAKSNHKWLDSGGMVVCGPCWCLQEPHMPIVHLVIAFPLVWGGPLNAMSVLYCMYLQLTTYLYWQPTVHRRLFKSLVLISIWLSCQLTGVQREIHKQCHHAIGFRYAFGWKRIQSSLALMSKSNIITWIMLLKWCETALIQPVLAQWE
jgi:hypothetical protein